MDTIIYIYRWKQPDANNQLYCCETYDMRDYYLRKVGMSPKLLQICEDNTVRQNSRREKETGGFFERKRKKRIQEQERMQLENFLVAIGAEEEQAAFFCEETVAYFAGREFNGYFQTEYVRHLLRLAGYGELVFREKEGNLHKGRGWNGKRELPSHFIVLGQTASVQEILYELVDGIKSLKWILPARLYREEQQEFVDILYEDYGLAAEVKLFEEAESFAKVYPFCRVPTVILDFSEMDKVPVVDVAKGSIWLDMAASEEKRRRIEDRNTGIWYFSLKKEWKHPQKALNYLDTTSKNGYNT